MAKKDKKTGRPKVKAHCSQIVEQGADMFMDTPAGGGIACRILEMIPKGGVPTGVIAAQVNLSASNLSTRIRRLEVAGLVIRQRSRVDGRRTLIALAGDTITCEPKQIPTRLTNQEQYIFDMVPLSGWCSLQSIRLKTVVDAGQLSHVVNSMKKKGFVTKEQRPGKHGGREVWIKRVKAKALKGMP